MTAQCPVPGPTDLASVSAEAAAKLAELQPKLPAIFHFDWRGIAVAGRLEAGGGRPVVRLVADLGAVPYSAEDRARREAALALHGRRQFRRTASNRLTLTMVEPVDGENTMRAIVTAIALALIKARPVIDAAEPLMAGPRMAAA